MKLRDLLDDINEHIINDTLNINSKVTVHVYTGDGEAIEWTDIEPEYHGESDGYEINVHGDKRILNKEGEWIITSETIHFINKHPKFTWEDYFDIKQLCLKNMHVNYDLEYLQEKGLTAQQLQDIVNNIV